MSVHTGLNSLTLTPGERKNKTEVPRAQAKGEKLATYGQTERALVQILWERAQRPPRRQ